MREIILTIWSRKDPSDSCASNATNSVADVNGMTGNFILASFRSFGTSDPFVDKVRSASITMSNRTAISLRNACVSFNSVPVLHPQVMVPSVLTLYSETITIQESIGIYHY